jgi:outer membrane protein assembly factor BamE (lipoprotein component of BamABCDE complex)
MHPLVYKAGFAPLFALLTTLTGCAIPLPFPDTQAFKEESTSFLTTGVTTRDDVRKRLGPPAASRMNGDVYIYLSPHGVGHTAALGPTYGGVIPIYAKAYEIALLIIQFDNDGVVSEIDHLTGAGAETNNGIKVGNPGYQMAGGAIGWKYLQIMPKLFSRDYLVLLAPRPEDEEKKQFRAPAGMCGVYYYRHLPWYEIKLLGERDMIHVSVQLDEINMGDHDESEYFYFLVTPGIHSISSTALDSMNLASNSSFSFECVGGRNYFIEQSWSMGWSRLYGAMTQVDESIGKKEIAKRHMVLGSGPSDKSSAAFDSMIWHGNSR